MIKWELPVAVKWYYELIRERKTIVGAVPNPPGREYFKLQEGEIITFFPVNASFIRIANMLEIERTVKYSRRFDSARKMLLEVGVEGVFPGIRDEREGVKIFHSFPGYVERIQRHGIYAIGLEKIGD